MNSAFKRMFSVLLSLCLGWSILSFIPVTASADNQIEKVLATVQPGPVVLMDISSAVVATSTEGCTVGSVTWLDQDGQPASGSFQQQTYRLEIRIDAGEGYSFAEELRAYLNNSGVDATRDPSGKSVTLVREISPAVWAPTVIKHPGGETVEENGWASFVATAIYAESCSWILVSPDGSDHSSHFEALGRVSIVIYFAHVCGGEAYLVAVAGVSMCGLAGDDALRQFSRKCLCHRLVDIACSGHAHGLVDV